MKKIISSLFIATLFMAFAQDSIAAQQSNMEVVKRSPWDPRGNNDSAEADTDEIEPSES